MTLVLDMAVHFIGLWLIWRIIKDFERRFKVTIKLSVTRREPRDERDTREWN